MRASKKSTPRILSDLKKVDAYRLTKADYDEIPELTAADAARGRLHIGGKPVGRPALENPKEAVSIRLDADVIAHFKRGGANYQSRINAALRKAAGLGAAASVKKTTARKTAKRRA